MFAFTSGNICAFEYDFGAFVIIFVLPVNDSSLMANLGGFKKVLSIITKSVFAVIRVISIVHNV